MDMMSYWIKVNPNPMIGVFMRRAKSGHRNRDTERTHTMTEADGRKDAPISQAVVKEVSHHQMRREGWDKFSLQKKPTLPTPRLQTSSLQNCDRQASGILLRHLRRLRKTPPALAGFEDGRRPRAEEGRPL